MLEALAILAIVAAVLVWVDSMKARERAVAGGRSACERYELQFLDDTVSFVSMRFARDDEGRLKLRRIYSFEFSDTGNNRRQGSIVMLGDLLEDMHLEPYPVQANRLQ